MNLTFLLDPPKQACTCTGMEASPVENNISPSPNSHSAPVL